MSFFLETTDMDLGDTPIENIFINDYMPMANGTYVKVYLLGYKYAHDKDMEIDLNNDTIARHLEVPMEDVLRAWDFWQKKGIIEKITNIEDSINYKVKFLSLKQLYIKNNIELFQDEEEEVEMEKMKSAPTVNDLVRANRDPDINRMFNNIDNIIRRQTVPMEKQRILSWINDYNMPPEVIEKAFSYSVESRGVKNLNYVDTVVRNWYDQGLTNIDDVLEMFKDNDENYYRNQKIMKALGLHRRPVRPDEKKMMDKWLNQDGHSLELILEACNRDKTASPSINYVNGILNDWKDKAIREVEDIEKMDEKQQSRPQGQKGYSSSRRPAAKKTRFHNFEQRSDQYSEQQLEDIARRKREEHSKKLKGEV